MIKVFFGLLFFSTYLSAAEDLYGGTYFITSFLNYNKADGTPDPILTLHVLPSENKDTLVTYSYYEQTSKTIVKKQLMAKTGSDNIITLDYKSVAVFQYIPIDHMYLVPDFRIRITTSNRVKIIARYYTDNDGVSATGDAYLLPTTDLIGNYYVIRLPTALPRSNQIISIMSARVADNTKETIKAYDNTKGTIKVYDTNVLQNTFPFDIANKLGSMQIAYTAHSGSSQTTIYIEADSPVYVTVAVPRVDIQFVSDGTYGKYNDVSDYVAYMPSPISIYDCTNWLPNDGEIHLTTNYFSTIAYVAPFNMNCDGINGPLVVERYDDTHSVKPLTDTIPTKSGREYKLYQTTQFAIQSQYTFTSMARVGGDKSVDQTSRTNAFMTIVPEMSQYLTGPSNILTFSSNSKLEIYGMGLNQVNFFLDGLRVPANSITKQTLTVIDPTYSSYIIKVPLSGPHVFSSDGRYIVYVTGKNSDTTNSMYGYLAGYRASQIIPVPKKGITPWGITTTTIATTTKSSSLETRSSLSAICLLSFVSLFYLRII